MEHDHSKCGGHGHDHDHGNEHEHNHDHSHSHSHTEEKNKNKSNVPNPNKMKWVKLKEMGFAFAANGLVIGGTLIKVYIFSKYIENENDQITYNYISWFFLIMMLISYFRTSLTDHSQTSIEQKFQEEPKNILDIKAKDFSKKCDMCTKLKFERSSHCTTCQTCITRRDHHCVWIGKCVGFSNTQFFINYCIWVWAAGMHFISGFINLYNNEEERVKLLPEIELNIWMSLFINIYTLVMFFGTFGITAILIQQINSIYNECSFYERTKNQHFETYYLCCVPKNLETKDVKNIYIFLFTFLFIY